MKKRMLIVNDVALGGGVEKLMLTLILEWESKYKIVVVTNQKDKKFHSVYPKSVKNYQKKVLLTARRPFGHVMLWMSNIINWLQGLIFNHQDIVIAIKEGEPTKFASQLRAPQKYAWIHTDVESCHWSRVSYSSNAEELECLKRFDTIFCVSEKTMEGVKRVIGDPGNMVVAYNPINVNDIRKKSKEAVAPAKTDLLKFVSVGRLDYLKGYDMLVSACERLNKEGYFFEVWIIGDGPERKKLSETVPKLERRNITLLGEKSNPFPYMLQCNWFISPSRAEGFSLVSQEALVLEMPLMLTDCAGTSELIGSDGEYGIIMDKTVESIYYAMKRVLDNPELEAYYRRQSRKRIDFVDYEKRMKTIETYFSK